MAFLTKEAIYKIYNSEDVEKPIVQLVGIKKIQSQTPGQADRYRLSLSDGTYFQAATLSSHLNHIADSPEFQKNALIRLDRFICSTVHGRKLIIVLELTPLHIEKLMIGTPVNIENIESQGEDKNSIKPSSINKSNVYEEKKRETFSVGTKKPLSSVNNQLVAPISAINPYQPRWTIKARVTNKPPVRTFVNAKGEGKVLSFDLTDESGEVRCSAFGETAISLNETIKLNKIYFFSNGQVKMANRQYSPLNNKYEITFGNSVTVQECYDDSDSLPHAHMNFVPIADIENKSKDFLIDVIGVVTSFEEVTIVNTKAGKQLQKRGVTITDDSKKEIALTLWGETAQNISLSVSECPILSVKGARVGDYGGKSLSTTSNSVVSINPDIKECYYLRSWYDSVGCKRKAESLSSANTNEQIRSEKRSFLSLLTTEPISFFQEKSVFMLIRGYVTIIRKEKVLYKACPRESCNKKLSGTLLSRIILRYLVEHNGQYYCEKCEESFEECENRLMLQICISDCSGKTWIIAFSELAAQLLEATPNDIEDLQTNDEKEFNQVLDQLKFKRYLFKLRVKADNYQQELKIRANLQSYKSINYAEESRYLLEDINNLMSN